MRTAASAAEVAAVADTFAVGAVPPTVATVGPAADRAVFVVAAVVASPDVEAGGLGTAVAAAGPDTVAAAPMAVAAQAANQRAGQPVGPRKCGCTSGSARPFRVPEHSAPANATGTPGRTSTVVTPASSLTRKAQSIFGQKPSPSLEPEGAVLPFYHFRLGEKSILSIRVALFAATGRSRNPAP